MEGNWVLSLHVSLALVIVESTTCGQTKIKTRKISVQEIIGYITENLVVSWNYILELG